MFLGEQLGKNDVLQPFDKIGGPPTIRGDARTHHLGHFTTTTKSEFVGRYLPRHQLLDSSLRVSKEISNKINDYVSLNSSPIDELGNSGALSV